MSLITPTTVDHGGLAAPLRRTVLLMLKRRPMGSRSGQKVRAVVSSTMTTGCLPGSSSSAKKRPRTSEACNTLKYSGVTLVVSETKPLPDSSGRSSILTARRRDKWVTGKSVVMAARSTPGMARMRRKVSRTKLFKTSGLA